MRNTELKFYIIPGGFFLLGLLFLIIGANGESMAVTFSRPGGADTWTTSEDLINAFTFVPMVLGIVFLISFICTFSITFYQSQKRH
jgi:heme/copper-type cytochrome/quinol oxidase subunit 2